MGIIETFSKRKKKQDAQGGQDVYQYNDLPEPFRVQVIHIWDTAIGHFYGTRSYTYREESTANEIWRLIERTLAREHGVFALGEPDSNPENQCRHYLMQADTLGALDIIELSFRAIDGAVRRLTPYQMQKAQITQDADDAIEELNRRFQEHRIGYQYLDGQIVRVDSQFLHAESVKPALRLLSDASFSGPEDEFLRAFDHYRKGNYKEAVAEALKALPEPFRLDKYRPPGELPNPLPRVRPGVSSGVRALSRSYGVNGG